MSESGGNDGLAQLASLLDGAHLALPDEMGVIVERAAATLGWAARVFLIDYEQRTLVPLADASCTPVVPEAVDTTLAGRSFRSVSTVETAVGGQPAMWVPLIDGAERLGVLEVWFPAGTELSSLRLRDQVRWFAHLVGHLIAAKSPYGDNFHRVRNATRRSVASELVWSLLPPLTMASAEVVISGVLEPAERVAGDMFDYAVQDGTAHVAIFDATGHDLHSSVIGALAVATYRNARRRSADLAEIAAAIDATFAGYGEDIYATGIMGELDLATGTFSYLCAGHLAPLLLRDGKVVRSLDGGRRILLGIPPGDVEPAEERLQPGDLIVFYTDGIIEARDPGRVFFGLERFIDTLERCASERCVAPETLRRVIHRVLDHQRGVLQDDASVLLVEWCSDGPARMTADARVDTVAPTRDQ